MLIASISIGDSLLTLTAIQSLDKTADPQITYNLTHTDLPTDKSVTLSFTGENDAVRAFCAWIASDEPNLSRDEAILRNTSFGKWMA